MKITKFCLTLSAAIFSFALFFPAEASAQRRDYLTEAEIELVRDAQEIDLRIAVLTRAVERRLNAINNKSVKENEKWGAPPEGTRLELLGDIEKLLQKGIDDVDDVASRNKDNELFPKAVHNFADACREYQPQFKTFLDAVKDQKERGLLLGSIEKCDSVIEASVQVPKKVEKKKKS